MELNGIMSVMNQLYGQEVNGLDEPFLIKSLNNRLEMTGIKQIEDYCRFLTLNKSEADTLNRDINNTFSQFFRDPLTFEILAKRILPQLIQHKKGSEIRIWSAGCSTGQEAYSIAIMVDELITAGQKARFRIIATDRSAEALQKAADGVYDQHAVQNLKVSQLQNYFNGDGKRFTVIPRLNNHITFTSYDLLDPKTNSPSESIFGDFDLVFCCNLLFYYKPESQQFMIRKLIKSMSANGYLVTGEAEKAIIEKSASLSQVIPQTAIFQLR